MARTNPFREEDIPTLGQSFLWAPDVPLLCGVTPPRRAPSGHMPHTGQPQSSGGKSRASVPTGALETGRLQTARSLSVIKQVGLALP